MSCSGQIDLLNKLLSNKGDTINQKQKEKLQRRTKTPQALDILLDAEIHGKVTD